MSEIKSESESPSGVLALIACAILVVKLAAGLVDWHTKRQCLAAGYMRHERSLFTRYCVKRVDQTDVVIPFAEAMK